MSQKTLLLRYVALIPIATMVGLEVNDHWRAAVAAAGVGFVCIAVGDIWDALLRFRRHPRGDAS